MCLLSFFVGIIICISSENGGHFWKWGQTSLPQKAVWGFSCNGWDYSKGPESVLCHWERDRSKNMFVFVFVCVEDRQYVGEHSCMKSKSMHFQQCDTAPCSYIQTQILSSVLLDFLFRWLLSVSFSQFWTSGRTAGWIPDMKCCFQAEVVHLENRVSGLSVRDDTWHKYKTSLMSLWHIKK